MNIQRWARTYKHNIFKLKCGGFNAIAGLIEPALHAAIFLRVINQICLSGIYYQCSFPFGAGRAASSLLTQHDGTEAASHPPRQVIDIQLHTVSRSALLHRETAKKCSCFQFPFRSLRLGTLNGTAEWAGPRMTSTRRDTESASATLAFKIRAVRETCAFRHTLSLRRYVYFERFSCEWLDTISPCR